MGDLNRRPGGTTVFQPAPPIDQYGPLSGDQWATQGVGGQPVPMPAVPAETNAAGPAVPTGAPVALPQAPSAEGSRMDPLSQALANVANGTSTPNDLMIIAAAQGNPNATGGASSTTTGTSRVVEDQTPGLQAARENVQSGVDRVKARATDLGRSQEASGVEQSAGLAKMAETLQQHTATQEQRFMAQQAELARLSDEGRKLGEDYQKAAASLDPNRLFKGGKRVLAGLALAFGAAGATLARTENFAEKIISDAVNRDIDAQKTAIAGKRDALTQNQQMFAQYRAMFGDENAAREATLSNNLKAGATHLRSLAAKQEGKEARARTLDAADQLDLRARERELASQELLARRQINTQTTTQSGPAPGSTADILARIKLAAETSKAVNEASPAGAYGKADPIQFRDVAKTATDTIGALSTLRDLRKAVGDSNALTRGTGTFQGGRNYAALFKQARLAILNATSGKVFTQAERDEIGSILDSGTFDQAKLENLDRVEKMITSKVQGSIASMTPQEGQQLRNRLRAGRVDNNIADSLFNGGTISQAGTQAAASGFTPGAK